MALQFLYSSWKENGVDTVIKLASEGVSSQDTEYILKTVGVTDHYDILPQDEENEDLTNTLYLELPSSAYAIIRTGRYTVDAAPQEQNFILHAYIQESGEEISPLLYAINNCFRVSLTQEEQKQLMAQTILPATPFPRPQFKLSQAEIRKFFSQGRLRTLACLLQAVIDSHGNYRTIILNDNYHSLKYWFFGIHSCLPQNRTRRLTYTTYAFHKPDNCVLICSAPDHGIDLDALAADGNFVIDNLNDTGCGDIESANFSNLIVHEFWEDINQLPDLLEGIEGLMDTYGFNVATAAGLYKLIEFDFNWFSSAHEIHYFLGKIGTIDKDSLKLISHRLWEAFMSPDFKFELNVDNLPILAYMFRNTNDTIRWEIIDYIDTHRETLGLQPNNSFDEMYNELSEKLPFIKEFIPITLMQEERLCEYCENRNSTPAEAATFLYIIIENYHAYKEMLGEEKLREYAIYLFERVLNQNALTIAHAICAKAKNLPYDFLRYVLIQGVLNDANDLEGEETDKLRLEDDFVYGIARLFITVDPTLALELVKNHAREGKYRENTLKLYNALCRDFPQETAEFNDTLHERAVYTDFVTDSVFYKFASLQRTTLEELANFFEKYYITEKDRHAYFIPKLLQHLQGHINVLSIETSDYFLNLLASYPQNKPKDDLFDFLIKFLSGLPAIDLFDFYHQNVESFKQTQSELISRQSDLPDNFKAARVLIDLTGIASDKDALYDDLLRELIEYRIHNFVRSDTVTVEYGHLLLDKIFRVSQKLSANQLSVLTNKILYPISQTKKGSAWFCDVWKTKLTHSPRSLYPITAHLLITAEQREAALWNKLTDELLDTIPPKQRKSIFRSMLSYVSNPEDEALLKKLLIYHYVKRTSWIKRIFTRPKRKLFKNLP